MRNGAVAVAVVAVAVAAVVTVAATKLPVGQWGGGGSRRRRRHSFHLTGRRRCRPLAFEVAANLETRGQE
jgi:hypothetical protein